MTHHILRIDASARRNGSISRELTDHLITRFTGNGAGTGETTVTTRDLAEALPQIDEAWIGANFTPANDRNAAQRETLALSDALVAEVQAADTIVIGLPIYNFSVPASLKAWIDLMSRAGLTFRYTENGPEGLLTGKRVIVAVASGGTEVGSDMDFATGYLAHVLGFVGLTDVTFVKADRTAIDMKTSVQAAYDAINALPLAA